jgi:hypothetical protein
VNVACGFCGLAWVLLKDYFRPEGRRRHVLDGGLALLVLVTPFLLYGLFPWASSDEGIERELSKERFRAGQELRGLQRSSGSDLDSNGAPKKSDSSDHRRLPADTFTR